MWNKLNGLGDLVSQPKLKVFFGNHFFVPKNFEKDLNFFRVHQVHGKKIIQSQNRLLKADGHWTKNKNQALLIQTADCMPGFLSNGSRSFVCALHIGWRGLGQKILSEAVQSLGSTQDLELWIGPHIKQKSFCLDPGSCKELFAPHDLSLEEATNKKIIHRTFHRLNQYSVNLESLLREEAKKLNISIKYFSKTDTYQSTEHYSHRRNPYSGGRQWSFAVLD